MSTRLDARGLGLVIDVPDGWVCAPLEPHIVALHPGEHEGKDLWGVPLFVTLMREAYQGDFAAHVRAQMRRA